MTTMGPLDLIISIIALALKIWDAVNSSKAEAARKKEVFDLDLAKFLAIAQVVIEKRREEIAEDNRKVGDGQDSIDRELGKK